MKTLYSNHFFLSQIIAVSVANFLAIVSMWREITVFSLSVTSALFYLLILSGTAFYFLTKERMVWHTKIFQISVGLIFLGEIFPFWIIGELLQLVGFTATAIGFFGLVWIPPYVRLPVPRGQYKTIGTINFHLTDTTRNNAIYNEDSVHRDLNASIWYPSDSSFVKKNSVRVECFQNWHTMFKQLMVFFKFPKFFFYFVDSFNCESNSFKDIPVVKEKPFPLMIFSHGLVGTRFQNVQLVEELASFGWIVVAVEHTADACITIFPDGRIIPFRAGIPNLTQENHENEFKKWNPLLEVRVADVDFAYNTFKLLNEGDMAAFEKRCVGLDASENVVHSLQHSMDFNKVAMSGHSFGGATAITSCNRFPERFKSVVCLDTWTFAMPYNIDTEGVKQHTLFYSSELWQYEHNKGRINAVHDSSSKISGSTNYNLTLLKSRHHNFDDGSIHMNVLARKFNLSGKIDPVVTMRNICAIVVGFCEKTVKGNSDFVEGCEMLDRSCKKYVDQIRWDA